MQQVNDVIAIRSIGSAAIEADGTYIPNTPIWEEMLKINEELLRAHYQLADWQWLYGLSTPYVARWVAHCTSRVPESMHSAARDETDRQHASIRLHFEEDEESMYVKGRHPLPGNDYAFDFGGRHARGREERCVSKGLHICRALRESE